MYTRHRCKWSKVREMIEKYIVKEETVKRIENIYTQTEEIS